MTLAPALWHRMGRGDWLTIIGLRVKGLYRRNHQRVGIEVFLRRGLDLHQLKWTERLRRRPVCYGRQDAGEGELVSGSPSMAG